jgi:hypothetical protein
MAARRSEHLDQALEAALGHQRGVRVGDDVAEHRRGRDQLDEPLVGEQLGAVGELARELRLVRERGRVAVRHGRHVDVAVERRLQLRLAQHPLGELRVVPAGHHRRLRSRLRS